MDLYLVAVILNPTQKERHDEGKAPSVVLQPVAVMASDEKTASMKAMKLVPTEHADAVDRLEVRVLPFRSGR